MITVFKNTYFAAVLATQQPAVTNSSSSEDEVGHSSSTVVRRRRLRRNTTSVMTEAEEELESGHSEEEEDEGHREPQDDVRPAAAAHVQTGQGRGSSILNKCILIALVVAISMAFGHFNGKFQIFVRVLTSALCQNFTTLVIRSSASLVDFMPDPLLLLIILGLAFIHIISDF